MTVCLSESFPCLQLLSKAALLSPISSTIHYTHVVFLLKFFWGLSEEGSEKQKLGLALGTRISLLFTDVWQLPESGEHIFNWASLFEIIYLFSSCCICPVLATTQYSVMPAHPAHCSAFLGVFLCSSPPSEKQSYCVLQSHVFCNIPLPVVSTSTASVSAATFCRRRWAVLFRTFP